MKTRQSHHSHRPSRIGSVLLLIAFLPGSLRSQQAQPATEYISAERGQSIEQLVALALDRSPVVLAVRARLDAAKGERQQADRRPNPMLMSDWREQIGGGDRLTMVGLAWPLDLFRKDGRIEVAESGQAAAEQEVRELERTLAAGVRAGALEFLAAVRQLEVRQQIAATLGQFRDLVGARAASGAGPTLDRDIADVDARRAEVEVLQQAASVDVKRADLRRLVGLTPDQPLLLRQGLEQVAQSRELAAAASIGQSLSERPDIQLAASQVRAASATLNLARREAKPDVSVTAAYMRMKAGFPLQGVDSTGALAPIEDVFHNLSIGATVTLPWRDRRQGDIAAATARVQGAERDFEARRLMAAAEIDAARSRVSRFEAALAVYDGGLRALAGKNVDVVRQSYELGRATLLDVLNETRRLLDTETSYTSVLLETLEARNDLAAAMGVIR